MKKPRVFQIAKGLNVSSDALIEVLKELQINVKSHMSTLEDEHLAALNKRFHAEKEAIRVEDQKKKDKQQAAAREKAKEEREAAAARASKPVVGPPPPVATVTMPPIPAPPSPARTVQPPAPRTPPPRRALAPSGGTGQRHAPVHPARPQARPSQPHTPRPLAAAAPPVMPLGVTATPLRSRPGGGLGAGGGMRPGAGGRPSGGGGRMRGGAGRGPKRKSTDDRAVREAVRRTMATIETGRARFRRHRGRGEDGTAEVQEALRVAKLPEFSTVAELAAKIEAKSSEVLAACLSLGIPATINRRLDKDAMMAIADEFGYEVEFVAEYGMEEVEEAPPAEDELEFRPPVVTIMGHVDHGKTSLLDYIRKTNVIAGEAGGITQHIGAYEVTLPGGQKIAFLDTPGHEAFTAMRARGAQVTDIVVLVVAADDRVMPQTVEAIDHAKAASVPIIVAINKIDLPGANPEMVRTDLAQRGLTPEEWGGKTIMVEISAKLGRNVDKLLEMILLQAEILELKAAPRRSAKGAVIEARMHQGRGVVGTVLVQQGTLRVGDVFVAGAQWGRVRALQNERGGRLADAGPSTPVQILGWDGTPSAGDTFVVVEDERAAREIAGKRMQAHREQEFRQRRHISLDDLYGRIQKGESNELNVIIKGDVDGSVEALSDSLTKLSTDEVKLRIIRTGVGNISESDVLLAAASDAVIIGFHVRPDPKAHEAANREKVDIRLYQVIYEVVENVKQAMSGLLKPELKEVVLGTAEVREVFRSSKVGTIAGCRVVAGKVTRNAKARLVRGGTVLWDGRLASLRRFKDDVREVEEGYECGIGLDGFQEIHQGDLIETYQIDEIARELA